MDNQTLPQKPKPNFVIWIAAGVITLATGIGIGLTVGKYSSPILPTSSQISSYDDCVNAKGSIVQYSYPATCVTASGQRFTQPVSSPTTTPTETADPTASWKTYTNDTYGFSFQYPPELLLSVNCTVFAMGNFLTCLQSSDFSYLMSDPDRKQPDTSKTITVSKGFGLFVEKNIIDYPYDISTLQEDYKRSYNNVSITTINTTPTLKVRSDNNPENIRWVMIHNKNVYSILSPFNTQNYPVIDQILSTFKFVE